MSYWIPTKEWTVRYLEWLSVPKGSNTVIPEWVLDHMAHDGSWGMMPPIKGLETPCSRCIDEDDDSYKNRIAAALEAKWRIALEKRMAHDEHLSYQHGEMG